MKLNKIKSLIMALGLFLVSTMLMADNTNSNELVPVPAPPELPESLKSGEPIEPVVTIIHQEDATIYEHRINGKLYMVKVIPSTGPSYYLIDNNGDGEFNARRHALDNVVVPTWVLFHW